MYIRPHVIPAIRRTKTNTLCSRNEGDANATQTQKRPNQTNPNIVTCTISIPVNNIAWFGR